MIDSEILQEKHRVQKALAAKNKSVKDYMAHSHKAAVEIAKSYGYSLDYVELELPSLKIPERMTTK